jgi:hypothetical protein
MSRCEYVRPIGGGVKRWWGRGRALLALTTAVAVLGACEGQGLYDVPAEPGEPGTPGPVQPGPGRGEVVTVPGVGVIADLVVDPASQQAFLSNKGQHRVEVLRLDGLTFGNAVPVGSEPWGLSLNRTGDTLIVANSGGTNVSFVPTGTLQEHVARRFNIPRITLYEVSTETRGGVRIYKDPTFFNYADRPQHIAQDAAGRLVYSAISTEAAPLGTVRVADFGPGWGDWDARLLFHERAIEFSDSNFVVFDADSIFVGETTVVIWDHVPGSVPRQHVRSDPLRIDLAIADVRAKGGNAGYAEGKWRLPDAAELADTTYVAASGNRQRIVIGEGARNRPSRIMVWHADVGRLPIVEDIADITNNTSDFIFGVDLNANGTLGVARGAQATYFFGNDLRLEGSTAAPQGGGRGAGFLPGSTNNRTYAFEPTNERTVRIVETTHYRPVGEITIREAITGPFRIGPPRPGVDACPNLQGEPTCVVATAYGVTAQRRLLVLDVERQDIVQ